MKPFVLLILGVIACVGAAPAQRTGAAPAAATPGPVGKHPEMRAIMERFLRSPIGSQDDVQKIRDFALQSPDVTVEVDPIVLPFIEEDLDEGVKNVLLIGFLAGDAAAQLRAGVKRDDPIAGIEGELAIYLVLKAHAATALKDRKVISPSLDALLEVRARGQLPAYLAQARARRAPAGNSASDAAGANPAPSGPAN